MILVRDRCAEQREDSVTGRLHDVTVVAAGCVDHQLEGRVDDRAGLFGIEVLFEFSGSLDISKQRGDGLALSLECFGRSTVDSYPDLRFRRSGRGSIGFRGADGGPAFLAESRPRTH